MQRTALTVLALASPLALVLALIDRPAAGIGLALLMPVFPVALMALSGEGRGFRSALGVAVVALFLTLEASFAAMLWLRGASPPGLFVAALVQAVGIWLIPLVIVTVAYALDFEARGLTSEQIERLERFVADREGET